MSLQIVSCNFNHVSTRQISDCFLRCLSPSLPFSRTQSNNATALFRFTSITIHWTQNIEIVVLQELPVLRETIILINNLKAKLHVANTWVVPFFFLAKHNPKAATVRPQQALSSGAVLYHQAPARAGGNSWLHDKGHRQTETGAQEGYSHLQEDEGPVL